MPSETTFPADDLEKLALLYSGRHFAGGGWTEGVASNELQEVWQLLKGRYSQDFSCSTAERIAWHEREAEASTAAGAHNSALFHLDRLLTARPDDGETHALKAHVLLLAGRRDQAEASFRRAHELCTPKRILELQQWRMEECRIAKQWAAAEAYLDRLLAEQRREAALYVARAEARHHLGNGAGRLADLTRAAELTPDVPVMLLLTEANAEQGQWQRAAQLNAQLARRVPAAWHRCAIAWLKTGDLASYRRACADMRKQLGETMDTANSLAWACSLGPGAAEDAAQLLGLLEKLLARFPADQTKARHALLNTLGALLYRSGRFADAITRLQEGIAVHGQGGTIQDAAFLALAHHRLGQADQARRWKERMGATKPADEASIWNAAEVAILRAEVEAKLK